MMVTEKACGKCDALQGKRKQPTVLLVREGKHTSEVVGTLPSGVVGRRRCLLVLGCQASLDQK